jgi:hypothetical protein
MRVRSPERQCVSGRPSCNSARRMNQGGEGQRPGAPGGSGQRGLEQLLLFNDGDLLRLLRTHCPGKLPGFPSHLSRGEPLHSPPLQTTHARRMRIPEMSDRLRPSNTQTARQHDVERRPRSGPAGCVTGRRRYHDHQRDGRATQPHMAISAAPVTQARPCARCKPLA